MSKRRKARSSVFGLALVAMLAFGVIGAGAAQAFTWHIDGSQFLGKESVAWSGGPIQFKNNTWNATIKCNSVEGATQIQESKYSTGTLTLGSCSVQGLSACTVKPLKLGVTGQLMGSGWQAYERYNTSGIWTITGSQCTLAGEFTVYGTIAAEVGFDSVNATRSFTRDAELATGASGLQFYGDPWQVTGAATASLSGGKTGSEFGAGVSAWPEFPATWAVGPEEFFGEEEIAWLEESDPVQIKNAAGTVTINCDMAYGGSMSIFGGDRSSIGEMTFEECSIASAPKCSVVPPALSADGQIGLSEGFVVERLEVSGSWLFAGECPVSGNSEVSGSIGAQLYPEPNAMYKVFSSNAEMRARATGLHFKGQTWRVSTEVGAFLSGANYGEEFGLYY